MTTLSEMASELVEDEIDYFVEDGMIVSLSLEQIVQLKQTVLENLCNAVNEEKDALNDFIRAHAHMNDESGVKE